MPKEDKKIKYKQGEKCMKIQFIINADMECCKE